MTKYFKVNEDVEIGGQSFKAGESFTINEGDTLENLDEAIAESKVVNVAAPETITESEAKEAEEIAISREEAEAQGVDVAKAEAEATPVEVIPDSEKKDEAGSQDSSVSEDEKPAESQPE